MKSRKTGGRKKSPTISDRPKNIFEPMFTGPWRDFGISCPEKVGISVFVILRWRAGVAIWYNIAVKISEDRFAAVAREGYGPFR